MLTVPAGVTSIRTAVSIRPRSAFRLSRRFALFLFRVVRAAVRLPARLHLGRPGVDADVFLRLVALHVRGGLLALRLGGLARVLCLLLVHQLADVLLPRYPRREAGVLLAPLHLLPEPSLQQRRTVLALRQLVRLECGLQLVVVV